ncbi:hypothetical protein PtrV1_09636 [Pyrenophora tritici-repentis]|nr:hypothetical protein PtrV1_09636 [Pyrenophora tritici-repentis]KAF7568630.1 Tymo-45kd-70kd multi-domain protein [Pyrenophora tritici-repentis]KAI0572883.1 hypothetical protein Alg215_09518 [Pyrenophora tritici-repentis]KAI0610165.1 hypothetical protein TUN205_05597 [Pyrenophora tritici-repentis]KAI1529735.1 hypothetical protein PtrSN001A_008459 [Pyrenophora tritici-repentis]
MNLFAYFLVILAGFTEDTDMLNTTATTTPTLLSNSTLSTSALALGLSSTTRTTFSTTTTTRIITTTPSTLSNATSAIDFATSPPWPIPTLASISNSLPENDTECGEYIELYNNLRIPTYASSPPGYFCRNIPLHTQMLRFANWKCEYC